MSSTDVSDWKPNEFRIDRTLLWRDGTHGPFGLVVEVQLRRDKRKHKTWPAYLSMVRHRHQCQAALLVVCLNEAIARWCAQPIETGHPGWDLRPLVAGPHNIPAIVDVAQAKDDPFLTVLSAAVHCQHPRGKAVLAALAEALPTLGTERGTTYAEVARALLPNDKWKELEETMTITHPHAYSDWGLGLVAKGEAKSILRILAKRDVEVPPSVHDRIMTCTDHDVLDLWLDRAITASAVDELFM